MTVSEPAAEGPPQIPTPNESSDESSNSSLNAVRPDAPESDASASDHPSAAHSSVDVELAPAEDPWAESDPHFTTVHGRSEPSVAIDPTPTDQRRSPRRSVLAAVAALLIVTAGIAVGAWIRRTDNHRPASDSPTGVAQRSEPSPLGDTGSGPPVNPPAAGSSPTANTSASPTLSKRPSSPPAKKPPSSPPSPPPLNLSQQLVKVRAQCLDITSSHRDNGTKIQSWACDQTDAQNWNITGAQYSALGKCMAATNTSTSDGLAVVLMDCNGGPDQQWETNRASGSIRNIGANKCLTAAADFRAVTVNTCSSWAGQAWTLTNA